MRILVIGGAGYIGSHTVKALLEANHDPIVLDNLVYGHKYIIKDVLKVPIIVGQAGNKELVNCILSGKHKEALGEPIDAVMHFAAFAYVGESVNNPAIYYRNNVGDSLSLLETLIDPKNQRIANRRKSKSIPIVFSSSCATYGIPDKKNIPITETTKQEPINPYGRSKLMIEQMLEDFYNAYKLPSVILRYFNAAGADPDCQTGEDHIPETHLIPLIFDALTDNKKSIKVFGTDYPTYDGSCIRDFIHVSDIANAHVMALEKLIDDGGHNIYNLGTGNGYSVKEIIAKCQQITKLKINIENHDRRPGDPPILIACPKKANIELGWEPSFSSLESIITHAWQWYKKKNNIL